jgi:hypothetical protein
MKIGVEKKDAYMKRDGRLVECNSFKTNSSSRYFTVKHENKVIFEELKERRGLGVWNQRS